MRHQKLATTALTLILVCLLTSNCRQPEDKAADSGITQGTIVYNITYPQNISSNGMSFLFPTEMKINFSERNQKASFKSNLNLYNLEFIHQNECDSFFTLLKILEKKVCVPADKESTLFLFNGASKENIKFSDEEPRVIAGFNCHKATYIPNNPNYPTLSIWYTNEIGIEDPNRNTPFGMIPGLMLEFEIVYQNIIFHLKADTIIEESHPDKIFEIPAGYQPTTIEEIETLIKSVMNA